MKRFGHTCRNSLSEVKECTLSDGLNDLSEDLRRLWMRLSGVMTFARDWWNREGGLER